MLLHLGAQLGDQPLCRFGKQLSERKRGEALHRGGGHHDQHQFAQQVNVVLGDDVVNQEPGGIRQHQAGDAVDHHQQEAQRQQATPRTNQLPHVGQHGA